MNFTNSITLINTLVSNNHPPTTICTVILDATETSRGSTDYDFTAYNYNLGNVIDPSMVHDNNSNHPFNGFPVRIPVGHWRTQNDVTEHTASRDIVVVVVVMLYMLAIALLVGAHCCRQSPFFRDQYDPLRTALISTHVPESAQDPGPKALTALQRIRVIMRAATNKNTNIRTLVPTEVV